MSAIWKGILEVNKIFSENISFHVGSGERTFFWLDRWVGGRSLAAQFPYLLNCATAMDKEALVKCYMSRVGDQLVWNPILRRNLKEH